MTCRTRISAADRQLASRLGRHVSEPRETRIMRDVWRDWGGLYVATADPDLSPEERDTVIRIGRRRFGPREGGAP